MPPNDKENGNAESNSQAKDKVATQPAPIDDDLEGFLDEILAKGANVVLSQNGAGDLEADNLFEVDSLLSDLNSPPLQHSVQSMLNANIIKPSKAGSNDLYTWQDEGVFIVRNRYMFKLQENYNTIVEQNKGLRDMVGTLQARIANMHGMMGSSTQATLDHCLAVLSENSELKNKLNQASQKVNEVLIDRIWKQKYERLVKDYSDLQRAYETGNPNYQRNSATPRTVVRPSQPATNGVIPGFQTNNSPATAQGNMARPNNNSANNQNIGAFLPPPDVHGQVSQPITYAHQGGYSQPQTNKRPAQHQVHSQAKRPRRLRPGG